MACTTIETITIHVYDGTNNLFPLGFLLARGDSPIVSVNGTLLDEADFELVDNESVRVMNLSVGDTVITDRCTDPTRLNIYSDLSIQRALVSNENEIQIHHRIDNLASRQSFNLSRVKLAENDNLMLQDIDMGDEYKIINLESNRTDDTSSVNLGDVNYLIDQAFPSEIDNVHRTYLNGEWVAQPALTFDGSYNSLTDLPTLFSGSFDDLQGVPVSLSGSYNDLTDLPTLFSGSYSDLSNKPTVFNLEGAPSVSASDAGKILSVNEAGDNFILAEQAQSSEVPVGTLSEFHKSVTIPSDFLPTNGQQLSVSSHDDYRNVLGNNSRTVESLSSQTSGNTGFTPSIFTSHQVFKIGSLYLLTVLDSSGNIYTSTDRVNWTETNIEADLTEGYGLSDDALVARCSVNGSANLIRKITVLNGNLTATDTVGTEALSNQQIFFFNGKYYITHGVFPRQYSILLESSDGITFTENTNHELRVTQNSSNVLRTESDRDFIYQFELEEANSDFERDIILSIFRNVSGRIVRIARIVVDAVIDEDIAVTMNKLSNILYVVSRKNAVTDSSGGSANQMFIAQIYDLKVDRFNAIREIDLSAPNSNNMPVVEWVSGSTVVYSDQTSIRSTSDDFVTSELLYENNPEPLRIFSINVSGGEVLSTFAFFGGTELPAVDSKVINYDTNTFTNINYLGTGFDVVNRAIKVL